MIREALAEEAPLQQRSEWRRNEPLGEILWGRIAPIRGREMCKGPGVEVTWHVWRITETHATGGGERAQTESKERARW